MAKQTAKQKSNDPSPYYGPIERVDGVRPFNGYLWNTEDWWANREVHHSIGYRHMIGIVALADGRFSVEGFVHAIEKNEYAGKPVVFATRTAAIRVAAARAIRLARWSRKWKGSMDQLEGKRLADVINWARNTVARETGKPEPKPVQVKEPPPPFRPTGLPLFDFGQVKS